MDFRPMRRERQALTERECAEILSRATSGVLAVLGDGGYPYAVPLSFACAEGRVYFHCARSGYKLDAVRRCNQASFCVVDQDQVTPAEYTTYYRSVILFGRVREVTEAAETRRALVYLAEKYAPGETEARRDEMISRELPAVHVLALEVEHMTGKEARELKRRAEKE